MLKKWLAIFLIFLLFINFQSVKSSVEYGEGLYFDNPSDNDGGILDFGSGNAFKDFRVLLFNNYLPSYGMVNLDEYGVLTNSGDYLLYDPPKIYTYFDGELVSTNIFLVWKDTENPDILWYGKYDNSGFTFRPPSTNEYRKGQKCIILFELVWKDITLSRVGTYTVTEDFSPTSVWGLIPASWWEYFPSEYKDYLKGEQGIQGIQGEQGIQGVQGEKGDIGPTGKDGLDAKDVPTTLIYISLGASVLCLFIVFNRNYKVEKKEKNTK